ncbi:MAG: SOS response-associated peptidase [Deltaproteobacteria bacterium]|nr:SOS response-associated peptidase [Deltaproteobacteria bacterium]
MCGRFSLASEFEAIRESFGELIFEDEWILKYNIAPSSEIPVIADFRRERVSFFRWGLIPYWAKDPKIGSRMINARAETLEEKPSFRTPFKQRRCLILADGFYEWKKEKERKTPYRVCLKSKKPFAFAGLWDQWRANDGRLLYSCVIITTAPNELVRPIHDRMPAILRPEDYPVWLGESGVNTAELKDCLKPYDDDLMMAYRVSPLLNNPRNDRPDLIEPSGDTP